MHRRWIGFDLDEVIVRGPFDVWIERRLRSLIASSSPSSSGEPWTLGGEIDRRIEDDARIVFARLAEVDPVDAFDWDLRYGAVALSWGVTTIPAVLDLVKEALGTLGDAPGDVLGKARVLPGAVEAIELARGRGYAVAALSNGFSRFQRPILEALQIDGLFDDIVTPDRVGACKPSPTFFAARPGLVAHVGDSLWQDVKGARRAGVDAIWVHADAPDPATVDPATIVRRSRSVANLQRRIPNDGLPDDPLDVIPHAAGRTPYAALAAWLAWREGA